MSDDLMASITWVRRSTRNQDMLNICDALEQRLLAERSPKVQLATVEEVPAAKLSRAEIQKNYRRRKKEQK